MNPWFLYLSISLGSVDTSYEQQKAPHIQRRMLANKGQWPEHDPCSLRKLDHMFSQVAWRSKPYLFHFVPYTSEPAQLERIAVPKHACIDVRILTVPTQTSNVANSCSVMSALLLRTFGLFGLRSALTGTGCHERGARAPFSRVTFGCPER